MSFFFARQNTDWKRSHFNVNFQIDNFYASYRQLHRASGKCHKLWLRIQQYEALRGQLETMCHQKFSLKYPAMFEPNFIERREKEIETFISPLYDYISQAAIFVHEFLKKRKNGFLSVKIKETNDEENKRSNMISKEIGKILKDWKLDLESKEFNDRSREAKEEAIKDFRKALNTHFVREVRKLKALPGNVLLFNELQELLNQFENAFKTRNNAVNTPGNQHRLQILYLSALDVNNCLNHQPFSLLIEAAENMLTQKLNIGTNIVQETPAIPGLQKFGPFFVRTLPFDVKESMDFSTALKKGFFTYFATGHKDSKSSENIVFTTSPPAKISITDPATLEHLKIPPTAARYQYVYPVFEEMQPETTGDYALDMLKKYGGYLYHGKNDEMVQLNGLKPGGHDLYFDGPNIVTSVMTDTIAEARRAKRFHKPTIPALGTSGVKSFAWFIPGELGQLNHGCIVVEHENPNWPMTYFGVINVKIGQGLQEKKNAELEQMETLVQHYTNVVIQTYEQAENY